MTSLQEDQDMRLQVQHKLSGLVNDITDKMRHKRQLYRNLESRKLERQLDEIDSLKSAVDTKTSLVAKLDHESNVKDLYIRLSWYFVYVIVFLVIPWVFYMGGWISYRPFIYIVLIAIVAYLGYIAYALNAFFYRSRGPTTEEEAIELSKEIGNAIYKEGKRLERDARDFIYSNCDCTSDGHKKKDKKDKKDQKVPALPFSIGGGVSIDDPDLRGYYYSDSGTPLEKIVPKIDEEKAKKDRDPTKYFKIDWMTRGGRILSKGEKDFCDALPAADKCKIDICCPLPKAQSRKQRYDPENTCTTDYDDETVDTTAKYKPFYKGGTWTMGL